MKHLSFLTIFLSILMNSQQFKPAEITFNNGEKIKVNVAYNTPFFTPQSFEFKEGSDKSKKLGINEIKEVNITDKAKFIKAEIEISRHPENLKNLELHKAFNIKKEEHFIEQIVFGKYNLYVYADEKNKAFYYKNSEDTTLKPLLFKEYFIDSGENEGDKTSNKQYVQDLKEINCGNIDYNNVRYLESSLINYFNNINKCSGSTITEYQKSKGYIEHKIYGNYSKVNETGETGFGGGYEFEYHLPFNNYSFAIAAAPGFVSYKENENLSFTQITYIKIISLPIILRYYPVKTKDFKMYASYSIVNFSQIHQKLMSYNNNVENFKRFTAFENNFFELGFRFKTLEAFSRFHSQSGGKAISMGLKYNIYSTKR